MRRTFSRDLARKEWAGKAQRERVRDAVQAYMQVRVVHGPLDELHYAQRSICSDLEQQSAHRGRPLTDTILDLQTDAKLAWTCDAFVLGGARVAVANIRCHAWQTWIIHGGAIRVNRLEHLRGQRPLAQCCKTREVALEAVPGAAREARRITHHVTPLSAPRNYLEYEQRFCLLVPTCW